MNTKFDIVIVGVGGQGTLLASKILGRLAMNAGLNVKVSEVHGMSQRGGSVITHVRVGEEVFAPMVPKGQADYLLGFETLETARAAEYLKPDGVVIMNSQKISPMPVITGAMAYPDHAVSLLTTHKVYRADALQFAIQAGNAKTVNLVLLGILSNMLSFDEEMWHEAIGACVPRKLLGVNLDAFDLGRALTC